MTLFREGDRVVKARRYSEFEYCAYGGSEHTVPLGSIGIVTSLHNDDVHVEFDMAHWGLSSGELDLIRHGSLTSKRRSLTKKAALTVTTVKLPKRKSNGLRF